MKKLTIGVLAKQAGVSVETVRFYVQRGLLKKPKCKSTRFKEYAVDDASRIHFIKRTQELGFTLKEIKNILELNTDPQATCRDVKRKAEKKIEEIEEKLSDLRRMKRSLDQLVAACGESKQALNQCRILNCFEPGWKC